jgi:hypothetical protein
MTMTYGKTTSTQYSEPEVQEMIVHAVRLGSVIPLGAHVVDRFPILRHVPFFTFHLRKWHQEELGLFSRLVDGAKERAVSA